MRADSRVGRFNQQVAIRAEPCAALLTACGVGFIDRMAPLTDYAGHLIFSITAAFNIILKVRQAILYVKFDE
jgi:predicted DCC family thiol-disulfide oxidoreductase YuxK